MREKKEWERVGEKEQSTNKQYKDIQKYKEWTLDLPLSLLRYLQ
jgi:hypothetical protein